MKTKFVTIVAALAAMASMAQTNQVLSKNAVGYEKVTISATGKFEFVRVDFNAIGTSNTFYNYLGSQLPVNSAAYFWDITGQTWQVFTRSGKGWGTVSNRVLSLGDAMFVKSPDLSTTNIDVYLMGEVPDNASSTIAVAGGGAFTASGYAYPVAKIWSTFAIASNMVSGDSVYTWDTSAGWQVITRSGKGWGAGTNMTIKPGQGVFIRKNSANGTNWFEVKPYTWP